MPENQGEYSRESYDKAEQRIQETNSRISPEATTAELRSAVEARADAEGERDRLYGVAYDEASEKNSRYNALLAQKAQIDRELEQLRRELGTKESGEEATEEETPDTIEPAQPTTTEHAGLAPEESPEKDERWKEQKKLFEELHQLEKDSDAWIEKRNQIVDMNRGLAHWLVAQNRWEKSYPDQEKGDFESYAYEGLIFAVENFDYNRGCKFSSYAIPTMEGYIFRNADNAAGVVRLPSHVWDTMRRVRRIQRNLEDELQREPTENEFMNALSADSANRAVTNERLARLVRESYRAIQLLNMADIDQIVGEEPIPGLLESISVTLGEHIEDEKDFRDEIISSVLREKIEEVLEELTEREREVIRLRFGLADGAPHTLEEVGSLFKLPRERIRQIEAKALKKLRYPSRKEKLREIAGIEKEEEKSEENKEPKADEIEVQGSEA